MSRKPLRNLSPERITTLFSDLDLDLDTPEVIREVLKFPGWLDLGMRRLWSLYLC